MTSDSTRNVQIGHVDARDEQQERDRAEQHEHRLSHTAAEDGTVSGPRKVWHSSLDKVGNHAHEIGAHGFELGLC
jgi:hypothetical protein